MTTMTDALVRFGQEAADMFLEIGVPELALKRGSDRVAIFFMLLFFFLRLTWAQFIQPPN